MEHTIPKIKPEISFILRLFYLCSVSSVLFALFSHWAYDDPFITYRYADNLAHGLGLVYNPGEHVLSTTTPLFALLLAGLSLLWSDLPHLANLIGAVSLAFGGLFLWDLARSWETPVAGWAGLVLYPTFPLLLTTLGSETPLYLAFCLGAFAFYARRQVRWTAVMAALAILARPDGALVPIILAADYLLRVRKPIPWIAVVLFIGITGLWFGFAWAYFGSPLPATLAAKQQQGAMAASQLFAPGLLTILADYTGHWHYWLEAALAVLGLITLVRSARRWALLLFWTLLYFTAYSILGVSRYYWYYAPLVPGFIALVGLGLFAIRDHSLIPNRRSLIADRPLPDYLVTQAPDYPPPDRRSPIADRSIHIKAALSIALIALLCIAQFVDLLQLRQHSDRRALVYQAIGKWLRSNTAPTDRFGSLEVGIIGYYAQRPVVDFAGLIQPEVASHLTIGTYEDVALWAVNRYHPNYLVLQKGSFPRLEGGYVSQNCRVIQKFPGKTFGYSANLLIYDCR